MSESQFSMYISIKSFTGFVSVNLIIIQFEIGTEYFLRKNNLQIGVLLIDFDRAQRFLL